MRKRVLATARHSIGAALALLLSAAAFAGPAEDYAAAQKAFHSGDLPRAMQLLERASNAGHAPAQAMLAWILDGAEENSRAVALYRRSAAQGYPEGQFGLATMYLKGEGVARNNAEAVKLLTSAAEQGHGQSAALLGSAYLNGDLGLEKDPAQGRTWLEQAAAAGDPSARQQLERLDGAAQEGGDAAE
jgi:TPR repeat protein